MTPEQRQALNSAIHKARMYAGRAMDFADAGDPGMVAAGLYYAEESLQEARKVVREIWPALAEVV